ncbi:MAG: hypothetical protein R3B90_07075 [Planctomycetaceae bacterium]
MRLFQQFRSRDKWHRQVCAAVLLLFAAVLPGCQCCSLTHTLSRAVDHVSDLEGHLDCWYCPSCDPSRINLPGGPCDCRSCCSAVVPRPVYAHRWGSGAPADQAPGSSEPELADEPKNADYFPAAEPAELLPQGENELDGESGLIEPRPLLDGAAKPALQLGPPQTRRVSGKPSWRELTAAR